MDRLRSGQYTPKIWLRQIALEIGLPVNKKFRAGRKWMKGFLFRYGLSFRIPYLKRRTPPDDDVIANLDSPIEN